jgi:hypothetical protein
MNERIQELAKQAMKDTSMSFAERWDRVHRSEFMEVYNEKFAELIVRECAQFIFVLDAEPMSHKSAARLLQEHFGVE